MPIFEVPGAILLFILIPPGIYFRHFFKKRGGIVNFPFQIWKGEGFSLPQTGTKFLYFVSALFFWAGISFYIIAAAGPVRIKSEKIFLTRGMDIVFVLDESPSMSADDFQPGNRFEAAKNLIKDFIKNRRHDPIGIVSFGSNAAVRIPPTLDYKAVFATMEGLSIQGLGDGTAIGSGLAVACLHLKNSTARKKIIILLTDGDNNSGGINPETASKLARRMGIKIYTIGVGSKKRVKVSYRDPETGETRKSFFSGGFNEDLLKKIASASNGLYFSAQETSALEDVLRTIEAREVVERKTLIKVRKKPEFKFFAIMGLICFSLDFLIRKIILREIF